MMPNSLLKKYIFEAKYTFSYFDDACKVSAVEVVVRFEEHLSQSALADGIVLGVELVEPVKCVSVRVDVQHVHGQVKWGQVHWLEHLLQRHLLARFCHCDHFVSVVF